MNDDWTVEGRGRFGRRALLQGSLAAGGAAAASTYGDTPPAGASVARDASLSAASSGAMSYLTTANGLPPGAPANTRRAGQGLTSADGIEAVATFTDTNMRVAFVLPVTPTRFRIQWNNQSGTYGGPPGGGGRGRMDFTGMWIGEANIPAANPPTQWNGDFLAKPTAIAMAQSLGSPTTRAFYTSDWVDNSAIPIITAGTLMAASIGWTNAAVPLWRCGSQAFVAQGTGCSSPSNAGAAAWNTGRGDASYTAIGSWLIEFEWIGSNPIGLWCGDSLQAGVLGSNNNNPQSTLGPSTRYPERVGLRLGHIVENCGANGKSLHSNRLTSTQIGNGSFTNDNYYSKFWFNNPTNVSEVPCIPDYAVIALGSNDLGQWDNTAIIKSAFVQMVQTIRQGLGVPRLFALTVPPFLPSGWSRLLHREIAGGSTTEVPIDVSPADETVIVADPLDTTVNQNVTISSRTFTGDETLTLSSVSGANASGGYAQVGGTDGCIIRYTAVSGKKLQNVLFVKGKTVRASAGATAVVGANWATIELGGADNAIYESVYFTSTSFDNGIGTLSLALEDKVLHRHAAGTVVTAGSESVRQNLNAWLRTGPPGVDATIDVAAASEVPGWLPNSSGSTHQFGTYSPGFANQHPYFWAVADDNPHPRSQAWHNYVAQLITPQLIGI